MIKDAAKREEYIKRCTELYESYLARKITDEPLPEIHFPGDVVRGGGEDKSAGHKSPKSLAGKIVRDRREEKEADKVSGISVSSISDLTRCTLVIDSFDKAAETIKKFAEKFPYIRGSISNKKVKGSGYQGIHLKGVDEKGVPFEVQIHTPETLLIKKVSDCEYIHWRDFKPRYEVKQANNDEQKLAEIYKKEKDKEADDKACRDIYEYLYEITDNEFDRNLPDVEAAISELNERYQSLSDKPSPEKNPEISKFADLSKFEIDGNPRELDEQKLIEVFKQSALFKEILPKTQLSLIETCEMISKEIFPPSVQHVSRNDLEAEIKKLREESAPSEEIIETRKPKGEQTKTGPESEQKNGQNFGE